MNTITRAEELLEKILKQRMKFKQHYINDLILILPNRNFELLKYHYTAIMNIPIMSIVLQDKTEMPLHKLYGMDVMVRNIDLDFIITISMEELKWK